jgi:outer membrane protein insertion porin family
VLDGRQYFLLDERPDHSGRHVLTVSSRVGVTGSDTPIFENFFAGGFSTLRGFEFRGASPVESNVQVGGRFEWLNTVEYLFPLTADDMIHGVAFCDFGTVEQNIAIHGDDFRVAPGLGLRIMQYRARMLDATLTVERASARGGTVVTCTCPIDDGSARRN